ELAGDAASPDIGEGLQFNLAAAEQILGGAVGPDMLVTEILQIIIDGLHPGADLVFFIPGKIAQIVAQGHNGPGDEQAVKFAVILKNSFQTGSQRQDGLTGPGLADQGNDLDVIIQQQFQGKSLFLI